MTEASSGADLLNHLAHEFAERFRRGERPALTEYTDKYPELAADIRELFPAMVVMEQLGQPTGAGAGGIPANTPMPQQLGEFRILREVARGGMGIVYEAVQEPLGRHVALKVLPFQSLATSNHIVRFQREARAAANLHHTNIVPVFGVGEHQGIHYYAMQFIQGQSLDSVLRELRRLRRVKSNATNEPGRTALKEGTDENLSFSLAAGLLSGQLDGNKKEENERDDHGTRSDKSRQASSASAGGTASKLSGSADSSLILQQSFSAQTHQQYFRTVARLGMQVAEALVYAHGQGVLHRDIKPSNLLLDTQGTVWVTDFGLAKAVDSEDLTATGDIVGTLRYMAPERFQGQADNRSDVYGLGVTLYELLTLHPVHAERDRARLVDKILREEPVRPRKLDPQIPRDLETVVMKAVAKEPEKRYPSAAELAADLKRFAEDKPILARRVTAPERLWRWSQRNRALAWLTGSVAASLLAVAIVSTLSAVYLSRQVEKTDEQRIRAQEAEQDANRRLFSSLVAEARANRLSRQSGRRVHSLEILAEATRLARELQLPEDDFVELRNEIIACLPLVDLRVARSWEGHPAGTEHLDFDSNLERYVRFDHLKGVARVRHVADDSEVCRITEFARSKEPWQVVLSPDGRFLGRIDKPPICKVWRVTSQGAEPWLEEPGNELCFSPDSSHLAIARRDGAITVYELASRKRLRQWQTGPLSPTWWYLAFHPDKPQLAVRNSGKIMLFDLDTGNKLVEFPDPRGKEELEWLPDGKRLASGDVDHSINLWEASTGKLLDRLAGHTNDSIRVAIHPAGELLASTCWDRTLRLWHMGTGQELFKTSWNAEALRSLGFSRDGRTLAADVADHQLRLWELIPACGYQSLVREPHLGKGKYLGCAVSGKHPLLAVGMEDGIGLWELPSGRPVAFLPTRATGMVAFEASGALLTNGRDGQLCWPIDAVGSSARLRIGPPEQLPFPFSGHQIATNRDGRVMASAQGWGALVRHADLPQKPGFSEKPGSLRLEPQHDVRFVAVSPEGEWVATGSHSATDVYVKIWEARTGRHVVDLPVEGSSLVGFSPNGRWLLTTGGGFRLWAAGTWREGPKIGGALHAFAFSPDSKVLAVETGFGTLRLVDPDTGREYTRLEDPNQDRAGRLTFSPDGSQLLASAEDIPAVHAWDLGAIGAELAKRGLDWDLPAYPPPPSPTRGGREGREEMRPLQVTVDLGDLQGRELNEQAWLMANNPEAKLRDPAWAVELAQKAVDLCPKQAMYWNTLGVAHYRAGHWKNAIEALTKSMELEKGKLESFDTFFLAMAHWQLDEKEKARQWYDRAVRWLEKNQDQLAGNPQYPEELRRFRAEAAALLGVKEEKTHHKETK
jgi:serine/threonine protein kinase/WD40 repeat protein